MSKGVGQKRVNVFLVSRADVIEGFLGTVLQGQPTTAQRCLSCLFLVQPVGVHPRRQLGEAVEVGANIDAIHRLIAAQISPVGDPRAPGTVVVNGYVWIEGSYSSSVMPKDHATAALGLVIVGGTRRK